LYLDVYGNWSTCSTGAYKLLLGHACANLALDAALVSATGDEEVTLVAPVRVPGVGDQPVV